MITAAMIMDQAEATADLVGDDSADALWQFAAHTWFVAREEGEELGCTLEEVEEEFDRRQDRRL